MRTLAFWTLVSLLTWASAEQALALQDPSGSESTPTAKQNLLVNGDFEHGLAGWNPFWSRQPSDGTVEIEKTIARQGKNSVRIRHRGADDWSLAATEPLQVRPGELYEFSGWVQLAGKGNCEISVILRDASGQVIDRTYAGRQARATDGWRMLKARFMIPPGATMMLPRVIGYGPATVHVDDLVLTA